MSPDNFLTVSIADLKAPPSFSLPSTAIDLAAEKEKVFLSMVAEEFSARLRIFSARDLSFLEASKVLIYQVLILAQAFLNAALIASHAALRVSFKFSN